MSLTAPGSWRFADAGRTWHVARVAVDGRSIWSPDFTGARSRDLALCTAIEAADGAAELQRAGVRW